MVPAYAAYLALNNLTGKTRSWLMGQGHCVAAIDALNVLTDNLLPEQHERYTGAEGLSRMVADFTATSKTRWQHGRATGQSR